MGSGETESIVGVACMDEYLLALLIVLTINTRAFLRVYLNSANVFDIKVVNNSHFQER